MKTFRTLCSGGELFGIGARAAGWQHLDGYEIEPSIADVARLNGFDVRVADVCAVDYVALPPVDHLHGSPSCKSASQANTAGGETDGDRAVGKAIERAIRAHQGRTFSLENVWGYRHFDAFKGTLAALKDCGFTVDYRHINAADFGVPQTRKRLILRAVRGGRVPPMHPTHRRGGDMFHAPWVGWYAAIKDLLDTLPETTPAPWQLARMPKALRETLLIGPGGYDGAVVQASAGSPSFTVADGGNHAQWRAFLVGDQSAGAGTGVQIADSSAPAFTLRDSDHNAPPRACIVSNAATEYGDGTRADEEPMFSITAQHAGRLRAVLIRNENTKQEWGKGYRVGDEPSPTLGTGSIPSAYVGRWVRMTIQALGRFQTVPDSYVGLTPQINGNGVPCLLAQRIMESFS